MIAVASVLIGLSLAGCGGAVSAATPTVTVFPIPGARVDPTTKIVVPGYFVLRSRFVDYRGAYVMHCHILAHEDRGMMMTVEVATNQAEPHHH